VSRPQIQLLDCIYLYIRPVKHHTRSYGYEYGEKLFIRRIYTSTILANPTPNQKLHRARKVCGPWGAVCKVLSDISCLKAPGSCPGFLSQAPKHFLLVQLFISTFPWLRLLCQWPSVVVQLQSSRLTLPCKHEFLSSNSITLI
jgi:hypothetical protein